MLVYRFNEKGLFVGTDETELDPLESELQGKEIYLLPPDATFNAPEEKEGFAPVWDGEKWEQVEDNRGVEYWLPNDKYGTPARKMEDLGLLPSEASLLAPEMTEDEKKAQALAEAKAERAAEVERLTVEVESMVFDADETSQARMSVAASSMTDDETNVWVLHDNSVVQVTKAQLLQACRLARIAQSAVWTKPYENASV